MSAGGDSAGEGMSDFWGYVLIIAGVGLIQAMSSSHGADARRKAAKARAAALDAYAAELKTLLTKRKHSMQLDYHSGEHEILNKQGASKQLLLARADQMIGKTTAAAGGSGVKSGEGTTHDLVVSQRGHGQEALSRLMDQMTAGVETRSAKHTRSRTLLSTKMNTEINRIKENAKVMRENADTMYDFESKWGVLAAFVGGASQAYGAMGGTGEADDPEAGTPTSTATSASAPVVANQGVRYKDKPMEGLEKQRTRRASGGEDLGDVFDRLGHI